MGRRVTQINYVCDVCGHVANDGEHMWYMGNEVWCEPCCDGDEENIDTMISYDEGEK